MPTSNARVAIELYVDDKGTLRVREFADKTNKSLDDVGNKSNSVTDRMQAGWDKVQAAWVGAIAGIAALYGAWNQMNMSAKAEQEKVAFANLAASYGANARQMIAELKAISGETISTMNLVRASGTAMMMGIDPDTIVRLMGIARATSKQTGQDVSKAFDDISLAVGRQSRMILDNLGIIVEVEKANEEYAASLGKTAGELSDAEKKQAFLNATIKGGEELMARMGKQTNTNADRLQRFTAKIEDIKVAAGSGLVRVFNFLSGTLDSVAAAALATAGGIFKVAEGVGWLTDKLRLTSGAAREWEINSEAAFMAAQELVERANQSFTDMRASTDWAAQSMGAYKQQVDETSAAADKLVEAQEKLAKQQQDTLDAAKKQADEQARATKEMYDEAGLGADQYFQMESTKLVEKAAKWQKAGADQLAVEEWLYDELGKLSEEAWGKGEAAAGQYLDNVQAQTRTLVDEFIALQQDSSQVLDEMTGKVMQLDGTDIGLSVSFDGSAAYQGIDNLIARLGALQATTAAAAGSGGQGASAAGYNPNETTEEFIARTDNSGGGTSIVNNFHQNLSRSDIHTILSEQQRREGRS